MVNRDDVVLWVERLQKIYHDNKSYLTELDAAIGDADHGINLERGFTAARDKLQESSPADLSATLKLVAMTLISTIGGASGPLYGTFFLRMSTTATGKTDLSAADVVALFEAGLQGVMQRGRAQLADKTMVDTLMPAIDALKEAVEAGDDFKTALQKMATAAETGMKATIPLQARKGRASYLGERSIGHQDPGATSAYLMLNAAAELWGQSDE